MKALYIVSLFFSVYYLTRCFELGKGLGRAPSGIDEILELKRNETLRKCFRTLACDIDRDSPEYQKGMTCLKEAEDNEKVRQYLLKRPLPDTEDGYEYPHEYIQKLFCEGDDEKKKEMDETYEAYVLEIAKEECTTSEETVDELCAVVAMLAECLFEIAVEMEATSKC